MKTRDELNKMTKQAIIDLVCDNELLHRVNSIRAITFGAVSFVEAVGRELADKDHAFSPIIHSRIDGAGDLEIVIPKQVTARERNLTTAIKCSKALKSKNNSAKHTSVKPDFIKSEY
jgi:hypothetical protein